MIHRSSRRDVRCPSFVAPWLCMLSPFCGAGITFAAVVGGQVELNATHQASVPLHQEPRGTHDFQRVPDRTKATVTEVARKGRWVKPSLPDGRTGWVTLPYVSRPAASLPTAIPPAANKPQRNEEGIVERAADGDTLTVITANRTKLRIRMLGIDAPETPKGTKFPGQPYGPEKASA